MTSEMSEGSRWTCDGKRSIRRRQLDLLVVEAADQLVKLLLRGDNEPVLATPLHAEALHHGLEVEHLLHVAGDELADFVHDEEQTLARRRRFINSSRAPPACRARCRPCS